MSDRILVMDGGRIAQGGKPEEIYRKPETQFVADFVGQCNLIDGVVESTAGDCMIVSHNELRFTIASPRANHAYGSRVTLVVRPESVELRTSSGGERESNAFSGRLDSTSFFGDHFRSEMVIGSLRLVIHSRSRPPSDMVVAINPKDIVVLSQSEAAP
jgi:ABC-type Fe3+/spermidine/putrescine transport system ATPase subunit